MFEFDGYISIRSLKPKRFELSKDIRTDLKIFTFFLLVFLSFIMFKVITISFKKSPLTTSEHPGDFSTDFQIDHLY